MSKMLKDLINSLVTFVLVIGTVTSTSIINSTIESWSPSMTHHSAKREKVTRKLQGSTRDFVPLSCNMNLNTTFCESWLSVYGNSSEYIDRVYIPCGRCILMDTTVPIITFRQGIDILGKLVFPESYQVVVQTPLVVVQGELELVSASKPVNGISDITFVMTGEANQTFLPVDSNSDACGLGNPCAVGKKAFVVAGGRIQGKFTSTKGDNCDQVPF